MRQKFTRQRVPAPGRVAATLRKGNANSAHQPAAAANADKPKRDPAVAFKKLDTDNDGKISAKEWAESPQADDDAFTATSFVHIIGFAAAGTQHLSIDAGYFSEMKTSFLGYRGVHSISAAIGHRPGFTQPGNLSRIILTSGPELARISLGAAGLTSGTWFTPVPTSFDSFETNLDAAYSYKVRLESTGSRSFFDEIRVVTEPQ